MNELPDPRSVHAADVYVGQTHAATLTKGPGSVQFSYLPKYLAAGGPPVATTLPLTPQPVITHGGALPPFFTGLLPEGRRLSALRNSVKTSADDELSLLLAVGADAIGAVSVVPAGHLPETTASPVPGELDFGELLARSGVIDRVAIPGVQDKASLRTIALPVTTEGSGHAIVKLSPPEYPRLVENESAMLALLSTNSARIPVTGHEVIHDVHGTAGLFIHRFDRARDSAVKHMVEDATQVMGRYPSDKYNVDFLEAAHSLAQLTPSPRLSARNLLFQLACAWLTGNGDLHAKNMSVLSTDGGRSFDISPLYDVPSTLPYGDNTLALPVNGKLGELSLKRLRSAGAALGLPGPAVDRVIRLALTSTESAPQAIIEAMNAHPRMKRDVQRVLGKRREAWIDVL